jgi:hypothetical protein
MKLVVQIAAGIVLGAAALAAIVLRHYAFDARSPILRRDLQSKRAPVATSLIASGLLSRLARSVLSSERCGGAERVGVGAGAGVGGGWDLATGDRDAARDQ